MTRSAVQNLSDFCPKPVRSWQPRTWPTTFARVAPGRFLGTNLRPRRPFATGANVGRDGATTAGTERTFG